HLNLQMLPEIFIGILNKTLHSAKLKRLDPSVNCGSNQMTLSVKRRGTHHFLIDSGEEPLTPLSQVPSTCGFFVKRSRRDVQYAVSYQGCHVNKQEDEYSLPLRLWGEPMTMSCPGMLPLPSIFCFPGKMVVTIRGVPANELKVKGMLSLQLQFPQLPIFSQFLESTQSPGFVAPLPFSFVAADFSENQKMPENQNSPLLPNFFLFPGSESPAHPTRDGNAHTSRHQLPQTPLSQYPVPLFQEFPMMSGVFLPTTTPLPLPATSAEAVVTTPAPTGREKPSLQPEFPALFQYPFPSFSKYPQSPQEQTTDDADFKPQYLHPQVFPIPMFYPFNHLSQLQNAPAPVAFTDPPPLEKPLYQQHRFIPVYVVPNPILPIAGIGLRNPPVIAGGFLNPPAITSSHLVPSSQQEHQPFYHAMQPFYPFLSDQSQTAPTNI
uniref:ZP domain-containing protein n=1 Tax=Xiphophorus couchianus TaxID=32473 RepID=A0A3B5L146_9TELE